MTTVRERIGHFARMITRVLPDAVLTRIFPARYRWDPALMRVATAPSTPVRLYVAPVNSAGQGYAWARAAERHLPGVGAVNLMTRDASTDRYRFDVDVAVPVMGFSFASQWQRRQRRELVHRFTHILLESGRFAYGSIPGSTPRATALRLERSGLRIALLWHGSDIRVPSEHAAIEPDSPFGEQGGYPEQSVAILERNSRAHRRFVETTHFPVFVSTPGLLDVPRSRWLPVVVDPERWSNDSPLLERERPVVAFVPSNSPMKGSAEVDQQLSSLAEEGLIEYRRLSGIPSAQMPGVYGDADIVLDQFRLGDYGVTACEAMAAGRVVVGHVSDAVRAHVRDATRLELPIVESRITDVAATVRRIIDDRDAWRGCGRAGVEYVRAQHDGRASARALAPFLGVAPAADGAPR